MGFLANACLKQSIEYYLILITHNLLNLLTEETVSQVNVSISALLIGLSASLCLAETESEAPIYVGDVIEQYDSANKQTQKMIAKGLYEMSPTGEVIPMAIEKNAVVVKTGKTPASINQGGDVCAGAPSLNIINGNVNLPIAQSGTTVGFANDYDPQSGGLLLNGNDVVYQLDVLIASTTVNISLTPDATFDGGFFIVGPTTSGAADCIDDNFLLAVADIGGAGSTESLNNFTMQTGTYFIVVDGYNGSSGTYSLDIAEYVAPNCALTASLTDACAGSDELFYDGAAALLLNTPSQYASMRFTPTGNFDVDVVKFRGYNPNAIGNNGLVNVFITGDNGNGIADANNILYQDCFDYTDTGFAPWFYLQLPSSVNMAFGSDYHVVIGPLNVGGGGPNFLEDAGNDFNRGQISGVPFVPGTAWAPGAYENEVNMRVCGSLVSTNFSDLSSAVTYTTDKKYFNCNMDPVTLVSDIVSLGNQGESSFDVNFEIFDSSGASVFTNTVTAGPISAAGAGSDTVSVTASASWTPSSLDTYTAQTTVSFAGSDFDPTNDTSWLEHNVVQIANGIATELSYNDDTVDGSIIYTQYSGRMVAFEPCFYPVVVDSLKFTSSQGGSARALIFGDDGNGNPDLANILFNSVETMVVGENLVQVGSVTIATGKFYVGWSSQDGNVTISYDSNQPLAAKNSQMGQVGFDLNEDFAAGTFTSTVDLNNDFFIKSYVRPSAADDIGISSVTAQNANFLVPGANADFDVVVTNFGQNNAVSGTVSFDIDNDGNADGTNSFSNLAVGTSQTLTFSGTLPATVGANVASATATLTSATDADNSNDSNTGNYYLLDCITTFPYSQNFDGPEWVNPVSQSATGDWLNAGGDDMDWTVNSGSTGSSGTGPSADHTTGTTGNYLYTEASTPNFPTKVANLYTPCFDFTNLGNPEFVFWYHMAGNSIGSLSIDVFDFATETWTNDVWTLSGTQQTDPTDPFLEAVADLSAFSGTKVIVRFNGITGTNWDSDTAIDDIEVRDGAPATPSNVMVQTTGNDAVISWDSSTGATGYTVYWGTDPQNPTTNSMAVGNVLTWTHTNGVSNDQKVFYYVKATN
ncbi:MAG: hypothetical protein DWQ06_09920 [Calditrichaeota bacterium]|nr:MAG: hypothetical protein DWQ06_09920 [Calditrichota bacterium]